MTADLDLTSFEKLITYINDNPDEALRATLFYLKAREKREEKFVDETVKIVKALVARVRTVEQTLVEALELDKPASAAQAPEEVAATPAKADGPGYAPVNNLPFPTSAPLGTKPAPVVSGSAPAAAEAPAEGQNNSQVVGVKPNASGPQVPPNNSRVVNVAPIPRTIDGSPAKQ